MARAGLHLKNVVSMDRTWLLCGRINLEQGHNTVKTSPNNQIHHWKNSWLEQGWSSTSARTLEAFSWSERIGAELAEGSGSETRESWIWINLRSIYAPLDWEKPGSAYEVGAKHQQRRQSGIQPDFSGIKPREKKKKREGDWWRWRMAVPRVLGPLIPCKVWESNTMNLCTCKFRVEENPSPMWI